MEFDDCPNCGNDIDGFEIYQCLKCNAYCCLSCCVKGGFCPCCQNSKDVELISGSFKRIGYIVNDEENDD